MAIFMVGLDEQELVGHFLAYTVLGPWRVVSLTAYGDPRDPRYGAIWHHAPGHAPQDFALSVRAGGPLDAVLLDKFADGMLPSIVTATAGPPVSPFSPDAYHVLGTDVRWGFVFDQNQGSLPYFALSFLHLSTFEELYAAQRHEPDTTLGPFGRSGDTSFDRDLLSFDGFAMQDGSVRFTGLLYPKTTPPVGTGLNRVDVTNTPGTSTWEAHGDTLVLRSGWARPDQAVPYPVAAGGVRSVVAQWRDDVYAPYPSNMGTGTFTGGAVVVGPMSLDNLQGAHDDMSAQGWIPHRVSVTGTYPEARACVVYTRALAPLARTFVVVDARDPSPPKRVGQGKITEVPPSKPFFDAFSYRTSTRGNDQEELKGLGGVDLLGAIGPVFEIGADLPRVEPGPPRSGAGDGLLPHPGDVTPFSGGGMVPSDAQEALDLAKPNRYATLDAWVRGRQETRGARAAQLAVGRGGRLVVNRAYTFAEKGYQVTHPTHLMAIGSIAKPLAGMAAVHHFFPNGELSGMQTPLDVVLGVQSAESPSLLERLQGTQLQQLLRHATGWPGDFDEAQVASQARMGAPLPAIPGDVLAFLRKTPDDFYAAPDANGNYVQVYSGATARALAEAVSARFLPMDIGPDAERHYVERMRTWWDLPLSKARMRSRDPASAIAEGLTPIHSRLIEVTEAHQVGGPPLRVPLTYGGGVAEYGAGAGGWCMSAGTLARVLSGMDPTSNVPQLLGSGAVQRLLNEVGNGFTGLFVGHVLPGSSGLPGSLGLIHNGKSYGCWAVAGMYFPSGDATPPPGQSTTCIVYMENFETDGDTPGMPHLASIFNLALGIEQQYGWEDDDLFDLV